MKKVAFCNQKGGVGKSSGAVNSADALCNDQVPVLLIDLDPNGSSTRVFYDPSNYPERENFYTLTDVLQDKHFDPMQAIYPAFIDGIKRNDLYIMPSDISLAVFQSTLSGKMHKEKYLKRQIDKIEERFTKRNLIILIDLPSTLCDLCINGAYAADLLVILTPYESDGLHGIKDFFNMVSEAKESQSFDYRFLRNRRDERMTIAINFMKDQLTDFESKLFDTIIRSDATINNAKIHNKTVFAYKPDCNAAQDYRNFSRELRGMLGEEEIIFGSKKNLK